MTVHQSSHPKNLVNIALVYILMATLIIARAKKVYVTPRTTFEASLSSYTCHD